MRVPTSFAALVLLSLGVVAQGQQADPLLLAQSDPLEMARAVRQLGDTPILERLRSGDLLAIRAAPWLGVPEAALSDLAELAAGDDPDLAPAAALCAWRIASRLDPLELQFDERAIPGEQAPWQALADDESARPDIRRLAGFTQEALRGLQAGAPSTEGD